MRLILLLLTIGASPIKLTVTDTGVNGESLSAAPVTDAIYMLTEAPSNQLALRITVTPGTTTTFTVKCYESETGAANTWAQISICDDTAAAACKPDTRTYTIADYETQNSTKVIASRWAVKGLYAQCKLEGTGTGTIVVTGTRSWQ